MLRILNKLTLQNFVANNAFMDKQAKHNNKQKIKYKKTFPELGIEPRTPRTQSGCVTAAP